MAATDAKIIHKSGEALSDFEKHVDSFLRDIEKAGSETLKGLRLEGAKEVTVSHTQKACVLVAPFPQLVAWRKNFKQTQEKLEKMMPEHHVVLIAERTMMDGRVWARRVDTNGVRPRSRTLKSVQEALLDDLVYPADIAGKRTRVAGGKRVLKVILTQKEKTALTDKLDSLRAVYTKLTNKAVAFEFEA